MNTLIISLTFIEIIGQVWLLRACLVVVDALTVIVVLCVFEFMDASLHLGRSHWFLLVLGMCCMFLDLLLVLVEGGGAASEFWMRWLK